MTKDLTKGRPLTLILQFGLPILLGMLFQQMYNMVDTAIVGKFLGGSALASVGATGSINFLVVGGSIVIPHLRRAVDFLDQLEAGAPAPVAHDHS